MRRYKSYSNNFEMKDLLSFERFLTPELINVLYYFVGSFIVLGAVVYFFYSIFNGMAGSAFLGILGSLFSLLIWRMICEGGILFYKIYDKL